MKTLLIITSLLFISCSTQPEIETHCAESVKSGQYFKIYYSENGSQINKKFKAPNIRDGFYILTFQNDEIIHYNSGILNFENGIASVLNGCN